MNPCFNVHSSLLIGQDIKSQNSKRLAYHNHLHTDWLHNPLCLALLPVEIHSTIPQPRPRRSVRYSGSFTLRHICSCNFGFDHHLCTPRSCKLLRLRNSTHPGMVPYICARNWPISSLDWHPLHGTSLRKGHRRVRMERMGPRAEPS